MKFVALSLLALLFVASCVPPPPPAAPPSAGPTPTAVPLPTVTVRGHVIDEETGAPVDAIIWMDGREVGRGSFSVDVPSGQRIVLRVEAQGYQPVELALWPHLDPGRRGPLTLGGPIRLKRLDR